MIDNETAIKVDGVYKDFKLPHEKKNSIKKVFTSLHKQTSKSFETQHALKDISFEIKKGEFFGIVGRNGSGKSTLLKILAGIYQPTKGSVKTDGRLVPFIELGVGFNPELTGRQNVYLNGALLGFSTKEIDVMYDDIVSFAELEEFMDQKLKNYSSGMQVRLAFSVATRAEAEILLIDEVLAVGDADFQRKCFNYFKSLKRSDITVIFVSHDMDAIREYCDRAVFIEKNEIVDEGEPDKIAQQYAKLFTELDAQASAGDITNRWGKGTLKTDSIRISVSESEISIEQKIVARVDVTDPVVGIRVRSTSGSSVTGTNTKIEKQKLGTIDKNGTRTITWSFPNVLADGDYFVDPAILASDGIEVLDWWDEADTFRIKKERNIPYIVDPNFIVKVH